MTICKGAPSPALWPKHRTAAVGHKCLRNTCIPWCDERGAPERVRLHQPALVAALLLRPLLGVSSKSRCPVFVANEMSGLLNKKIVTQANKRSAVGLSSFSNAFKAKKKTKKKFESRGVGPPLDSFLTAPPGRSGSHCATYALWPALWRRTGRAVLARSRAPAAS